MRWWRRRQDSNLHRVAPERLSRPWQYQLCLLLQIMRDAPDELPKRPGFLLWHMTSILAWYIYLHYTSLSKLYFFAFGVTGGIWILDHLSHNQTLYQLSYGHMAARVGFEPTHDSSPSSSLANCPLNHLGTSPFIFNSLRWVALPIFKDAHATLDYQPPQTIKKTMR